MTTIFNKIANIFNKFGATFPKLNIENAWLTDSLSFLQGYWELANSFLPVKEVLIVLGILIAFGIAMFAFWLVQRLINLLRGSG